jgi:hypothetical protein
LSIAFESSVKILELYKFTCCSFGVNIKEISKIGSSNKYKDTVKAIVLKYFDNNLINQVEPEYKLMYLIISNILICHQINNMNTVTEKISYIKKPSLENKTTQPIINKNQIKITQMALKDLNNKYQDL